MQSRLALALAASVTAAGCVLLGFGPPSGIVEGWVYQVETQSPLPRSEVCAFGIDTICVRADREGHYRMRLAEQTVVMRFRFGSLPLAASDSTRIVAGGRLTVSCALVNRMVLSDHPLPCQPVPGR